MTLSYTQDLVYRAILDYPGITRHEIDKRLSMESQHVLKCLRRDGIITYKRFLTQNRAGRRTVAYAYYPAVGK